MRLSLGTFFALSLAAAMSRAQELQPYDGLKAGEEAYQQGEVQRQQRLNDQLYLNDAMRTRYGWFPSGGVVWYGNAGFGYGPPVGIDYAYAYSSNRLFGRTRGLNVQRYWAPPLSVFEPWPYVPGDIYGYNYPPYVRQSIGQRQIQTGPNRWESHPVYPEDVELVAPATPAVEAVPADVPPSEPPPAEPPVKKPRRRAF
jgi:hypothetical protein